MRVRVTQWYLTAAISAAILLLMALPALSAAVCYLDATGAPSVAMVQGAETPTDAIAALPYPPEGYSSAIPAGTRLLSMMVEPDYTSVDFSREMVADGIDAARVESIYEQVRVTITLFGLPGSVKVTVDGTPLYEFIPQSTPVEPRMQAQSQNMAAASSSSGLGGKRITLSPGHGLFWIGSYWAYERPVTCTPLLREDDHNDEIMRYLDIYLSQDGATTKPVRCMDKSAGDYASGKPWWQMSASYWLKNIGYPCTVYAGSSGDCNLGSGASESSDSLMSRPRASNYDNTDIYISLHSNALSGDCFGSSCPNGTCTYYDNSSSHATWGTISRSLAQSVQSNLVSSIRTKYGDSTWYDRGALDSAGGFAETREPDRAAILIELAFHDSCDRDGLYLRDNFFRSTTMWAVYKGVCDYFGTTPTWDYYSYEIVSEDLPAVMSPGSTRAIHITLRNRGVLWSEARQFRLGSVGDSDPFTTQTRYTVSGEIEPSQTVSFTINLTAPTTPGTYTTDWRMLREGVTWFGPTIQRNIVVAEPGSDTEPPTVPADLVATPISTSQINLSWAASTDNVGVAEYNVYRAGALIGTSYNPTYSDTGLTSNTTYSYQVSARDAGGNESSKGNTAPGTTYPKTEFILDEESASLIGSAWASAASSTAYNGDFIWGSSTAATTRTAIWTPNLEVAGNYSVYAQWVSGTNRTPAAPYTVAYNGGSVSVLQDQTTNGGVFNQIATNKPFVAGTSGYIKLENGTGATGSVVVADVVKFVCTSVVDTQAPSIPTKLTATPASPSQINLSWTASTDFVGVTGYKIYRNGSLLTTVTGTSYQSTGLNANTTYAYQVSAKDAAANESAKGNIASATTLPPTDSVAPSIVATNASPSMTAGGYSVKITVVATDNTGVTGVTADGIELSQSVGTSWVGYINASAQLGPHSISVVARDGSGNQKTGSVTYTTARVFGLSNRSLLPTGATQAGAASFLYKIWGYVTPGSADYFDISDGSGDPIRVHCADHSLEQGQFISVFGSWNLGTNPPQIETQSGQVRMLP